MPDPTTLKALADAGGWTLFVGLIVVIGLGATKKFRFWVPGWIYEDELKQRAIADAQAERTTKLLEKQATAYAAMSRSHDLMRTELARLRAQPTSVNRD